MKTITIKGLERESVGKAETKALRNAEMVPCVVYGGKETPIHFSVKTQDLKPLVYTPNVYSVNLEINGKSIMSIMQDIQFHKVTDAIEHIDFFKIDEKKEITIEIPVKITGNSQGVIKGGTLKTNIRKLKLKGLYRDIPDNVEVDITKLDIGNKIYVSEIKTDKYKILNPENTVITQVRMSRAAAKNAEAAATPKKK